jgi:hypothetical protein
MSKWVSECLKGECVCVCECALSDTISKAGAESENHRILLVCVWYSQVDTIFSAKYISSILATVGKNLPFSFWLVGSILEERRPLCRLW